MTQKQSADEPSPPTIYLLIKFGLREHMEQLRDTGKLFMQRLADFQGMEDKVGRGDPNDGLSAMYQPEMVIVRWGGLTLEGFAGPIKVEHEDSPQRHVFCLHALTSRRLQALSKGAPFVPPENFGLGSYAVVITNVDEFITRVIAAANRLNLLYMNAGLVDYIDPTMHHGEVDAFRKFDSYSYQSEWRIVVPPSGEKIFWFDLGCDLKDISVLAPAEEVNEQLKIQVGVNATS